MLITTVIGSYPQPDWLIDRARLKGQRVPRVRQPDLWRVAPELLDEAIADATRVAVQDMETAGVDIVSDGEIGRESYSNHFLGALSGIDFDRPATITDVTGRDVQVSRVTGPIQRTHFVEERAARFLRRITDRRVRLTLPGPFTLAQQCSDEYYGDRDALAFAFADAVNAEARDLAAAGIDVVQIDEPWFRNDPDLAHRIGVPLVDRAFAGVDADTAVHLCFGYGFLVGSSKPRTYDFLGALSESAADQISIEAAQPDLDLAQLRELGDKTVILGVIGLATETVETAQLVAERITAAMEHVAPERLMPAPDCGMKYLSRATAFEKLKALAEGAALVRARLG